MNVIEANLTEATHKLNALLAAIQEDRISLDELADSPIHLDTLHVIASHIEIVIDEIEYEDDGEPFHTVIVQYPGISTQAVFDDMERLFKDR